MLDKCGTIAEMAARDNLEQVNKESLPVVPKNSFYTRRVKRVLDVLIALPCFVITLPINLVIGAVTLFDVGSPIFFKQARIGKNGEPFHLVKFRNMTNETDGCGHLLPATERTTRFGKFVRSHSLDELLNFWFVLKGDIPLRILKTRPEFSEESMGAFALPAKSSTNKEQAFSQVASCFASGLRMRRVSEFNCKRVGSMEGQFLAKLVFGAVGA